MRTSLVHRLPLYPLHQRAYACFAVWSVLVFVAFTFAPDEARASGPVERFMQLLIHPSAPDVLAVRYGAGAGSHGFLFSRDGGKTFQLMCSANAALTAKDPLLVQRVATRAIPSTGATVLDHTGSVMFTQYGSSWGDDGTGCDWREVEALADLWPLGLVVDPASPETLWSAVSTIPTAGTNKAGKFDLMRRDASKTWTRVGAIRNIENAMAVVDATIAVFADGMSRRIYVSMQSQGAKATSFASVLSSDDDGMTWSDHPLPKDQEKLQLLGIDPLDPNHVIAAISRDGSADTVLLSMDGGLSFKPYLEVRAVGGVTFDATGRLYLADIGDGALGDAAGGLYTAARTGDAPTFVEGTSGVDCIYYQAKNDRLYMCAGNRFGIFDPASRTLQELARIDKVDQFLSCSGRDMAMVCQNQLNAGPSWCCAGHYPFTPICGQYDVTVRPDGGRVFCGLAGREYDSPKPPTDAKPDAAIPSTTPGPDVPDATVPQPNTSVPDAARSSGGCGTTSTALSRWEVGLVLALAAMYRRRLGC